MKSVINESYYSHATDAVSSAKSNHTVLHYNVIEANTPITAIKQRIRMIMRLCLV